MAAWTVAARRATNMVQLSSQTTSSLLHRRGLAGAAAIWNGLMIVQRSLIGNLRDVNFWQDPMSPSKWKEEHGVLLYSGYKFFTRGKGKNEETVGESNKA
uniref:Uncharacterized protein n=1 Tax=Glycine max TaxID=3847 RepID=A0A0R0H8L2_SOYBN